MEWRTVGAKELYKTLTNRSPTFSKEILKNPLDKLLNLCYNTDTNHGRAGYEYPPSVGRMLKWGFKSPTAPKKKVKKKEKKFLTNRAECAIIRM